MQKERDSTPTCAGSRTRGASLPKRTTSEIMRRKDGLACRQGKGRGGGMQKPAPCESVLDVC